MRLPPLPGTRGLVRRRSNRPRAALPPATTMNLDQGMRAYWLERVLHHNSDVYAGVPLAKFPEDLRVYEHLLWTDRPDTVIEIGTHSGGSAIWFRDHLRTLAAYGHIREPRVVTIDISQAVAREHLARADSDYAETIHLIEGDVRDHRIIDTIKPLLGRRCFVVEDSAHEYDTTLAALEGYSEFVPAGGYFVVEDGCVDVEEMRLTEDWPRGVLPALEHWLQTEQGRRFGVRRDLELYGMTCHPGGFLQRMG